MIKINKTQRQLFYSVEFVLRARSKNEVRQQVFSLLYADEEKIVCTDSRRMHLADNPVFEDKPIFAPGLYEVVKNSGGEIALNLIPEHDAPQFPNYKQILNEEQKEKATVKWNSMTGVSMAASILFRKVIESSHYLNLDFVTDVLKPYDKKSCHLMFTVHYKDDMSAVKFENSEDGRTLTALVMPIQVRKEED